jgi:hypothetical protein
MNLTSFLVANWDSVIAALLVCGAAIYLIAQKQYGILDQIVFSLVTEAEKKYGGGTGAVKLAAVIDWLYPKIPAIVRLFVSVKQIQNIIERVLADARKRWESNPSLSAYIGKSV